MNDDKEIFGLGRSQEKEKVEKTAEDESKNSTKFEIFGRTFSFCNFSFVALVCSPLHFVDHLWYDKGQKPLKNSFWLRKESVSAHRRR